MKKTIKEFRKERGFKQDAVAKYVGVNNNKFSKIERGIINAPDFVKEKISELFGVSIDEIEFNIDPLTELPKNEMNSNIKTIQEKSKKEKDEIKIDKSKSIPSSKPIDMMEVTIFDTGLDYLDPTLKLITEMPSDRSKFERLCDFKSTLRRFDERTKEISKRKKIQKDLSSVQERYVYSRGFEMFDKTIDLLLDIPEKRARDTKINDLENILRNFNLDLINVKERLTEKSTKQSTISA